MNKILLARKDRPFGMSVLPFFIAFNSEKKRVKLQREKIETDEHDFSNEIAHLFDCAYWHKRFTKF